MLVIKRPEPIWANQWFKNGDHPDDGPADHEGKVVRYFRHPDPKFADNRICPNCCHTFHDHGWIDDTEMRYSEDGAKRCICPGDWIITDTYGGYHGITAKQFDEEYVKYHRL